MSDPSNDIEGSFVIVTVAGHRVAVSIDGVAGVALGAANELDIEVVLSVPMIAGERTRLRITGDGDELDLGVPKSDLEIGTQLRGRCQLPRLVSGSFARSCLRGVVATGDELIYILDHGQLLAHFAPPEQRDST